MTRTRIFVALILSISLISAPSFASVKAGAKCTKAGITATAAGKKFTCIKSGKRLVWNKGVTTKAASKPVQAPIPSAPTAPQTPGAKSLLSSDPRITPAAALTNLEICKTADQTPTFMADGGIGYNNGFPRPSFAGKVKTSAKVLVVPMAFKNLPFTDDKSQPGSSSTSDIEQLNKVVPEVVESFKSLSGNR